MRYVQLRAFHNVCLMGGFSKAADALCLTQPAVSDQIRKLEEEYDTLLFHRTGKSVLPTEVGHQLLEITHRFFETEAQARELLTLRQKHFMGTLRIIADSSLHVVPALTHFQKLNPDVQIVVQTGNTDQVLSTLQSYEADVGVMGAKTDDSSFESINLSDSPLVAFVHKTHPLAKRKTITFSNLLKETLILRENGSRTRSSLEAKAQTLKLSIKHRIEAEGRESVMELVAAGAGVGIVSKAEIGRDPDIKALTIRDCNIRMQETLVCLSSRIHTRVIASFLESAKACQTKAR